LYQNHYGPIRDRVVPPFHAAKMRMTTLLHAGGAAKLTESALSEVKTGRGGRTGGMDPDWGILSKMARPALQHAISPHNIGTPRRHFLKTCSRAPVRVVLCGSGVQRRRCRH